MALTVAQLVARLTADTSNFYRGMAVANSAMLQTGGLIKQVAKGSGLAILAMGILSTRTAGNFEQSMNIVQAVTGATDSQFAKLQKRALDLGADFKLPNVSARDAADAMTELSKGGLDVNDVLGAVRGSLQLGLAANIDFAESGKLIARSLQAFDLEGNQAVRIANMLSAGANKSTAEITDLSLGFQNAAAQFHGVGLSAEDLTASLAILSDNALGGEYAGTALKTMLIRLTSPTDKAAKVMDKYGISLFDAQGNMKSMPQIIGQFQKGLGGLTQQQREQALTTIFGVRANQAMRILMGEGAEAYKKYRKEVTNTTSAQDMAEARTKGFNGALGALGSAAETFATKLGLAMLPALTRVTRAMAEWVSKLDPQGIVDFFAAIINGVKWIYDLIAGSDILQAALIGLAGAFTALYVAQKVIALINALKFAWIALNASFALSPIGLIVIAIGALIGGLILAYMKIEWFRNAVDAAFSWIKENVIPLMKNVAQAIIDSWDNIKEAVSNAVRKVVAVVRAVLTPIVNFIKDHMDQIKAVFNAVWEHVKIVVQTALNMIKANINMVLGIITGDWNRAWNGLKAMLSAVWNGMVAMVKNILTRLVPAVLSLAISVGKALLEGIGKGLLNLASWLWGKIKSGAVSAINQAAEWAVGAAKAIGKAIVNGIVGGVKGLGSALKEKLIGGLGGAIGGAVGWMKPGSPYSRRAADELGKPLARGIIEGFLLGIGELPTKMKESLRNALEEAKKVVDEYKSKFSTAFSQLVSDAMTAFDAATAAHVTPAERLLNKLVSQRDLEDFKQRMAEARRAVEEAKAGVAIAGQWVEPAFESDEAKTVEENAAAAAAARDKAFNEWVSGVTEANRTLEEAQKTLSDLEYEARVRALEKQAAEEDRQYVAKRNLQKRHLTTQLAELEAELLKHPEKWKFYQGKIINLLKSYGIDYKTAGYNLGKAFAQGLDESAGLVRASAKNLADIVKKYLQLKSPAQEGPLSTLDTWWASFGETLVSGLNVSPITKAAHAMAGIPYAAMGPGLSNTGSLAYTGAGTASPVTVYQVQGSLISERQLDERIREGIIEQNRIGRLTP